MPVRRVLHVPLMTDTASPGPLTCMALHEGITYGPLVSRRFGTSLGINLLPASCKLCSFNCVYCQYGWTEAHEAPPDAPWPRLDDIVAAVHRAVDAAAASATAIDRWTLAGHGEPTLHPQFPAVVEALRDLRARVAPSTPIGILSNSTTAHLPEIRHALARLDERGMKLDAGTQNVLRHVNAAATPIGQIVEALASMPDIAVQAMFVRDASGRIDNASPEAVAAWLAAIARIRPRDVQIYTLARRPAWARLEPVPPARLHEIADGVRSQGIRANVFL